MTVDGEKPGKAGKSTSPYSSLTSSEGERKVGQKTSSTAVKSEEGSAILAGSSHAQVHQKRAKSPRTSSAQVFLLHPLPAGSSPRKHGVGANKALNVRPQLAPHQLSSL